MDSEPVKFFPDILEEFFEELDFLWAQRESVLTDPGWTLRDLAELEERAEAHLDGLRLSGDDGVRLARPYLRGEDKTAATAAAFVFAEARRDDTDAEILLAMGEADVPAREGIGLALRHVDVSRIAGGIRRLAVEADLVTRSIAADILAFHRLLPPPPKLFDLFVAPDLKVRARAYGAAGRFGGPWSADELQSALDQTDSELRWAAIHASARLAMPRLTEMLRRAAMRLEPPCPEAVEFLGVLGDPTDLQLFRGLLTQPSLRHAAIAAMGASGHVTVIPWLLELMQDPASAAAAGSAFVRITGAHGINATAPLPPPANLPEDQKDFFIAEVPPDPAKARAWWEKVKAKFAVEARWQGGMRVDNALPDHDLAALSLPVLRDLTLASGGVTAPSSSAEIPRQRRLARAI